MPAGPHPERPAPPRDEAAPRQLDLFADSDDVRCRNDFAAALLAGDAAAAARHQAHWRQAHPADAFLGDAAVLLRWLQYEGGASRGPGGPGEPGGPDEPIAPDTTPPGAAATLPAQRRQLETEVAPAARALLGTDAPAWLAARWRRLAGAARHVRWQPDAAEVHAAALWLMAGDWTAAAEAVAAVESWRRIPQPLLWMAEARWRGAGADAAWPLLAESFWLAPARARALLEGLLDAPGERRLRQAMRRFEEDLDVADDEAGLADWAWWPAWLAVDQPLLAEVLAHADTVAEGSAAEGFRLVASLLRLERAGRHHDIVAARKRLRALQPRLFAAYMRTR